MFKKLLFTFLLVPALVFSQVNQTKKLHDENLLKIAKTIEKLEEDLHKKQLQFDKVETVGLREKVQVEINQIASEIKQIKRNFSIIVAQVDPNEFDSSDIAQDYTLNKQLNDILSPLVSALKDLTSRPREIDALKKKQSINKERVLTAKKALAGFKRAIRNSDQEVLSEQLKALEQEWSKKLNDTETQLSIIEEKLNQKLSEKKSLGESVGEVFDLFFKSRVKNLFFSLVLVVLYLFSLNRFRRWLSKSQYAQSTHIYARLFKVLYIILAVFGTLIVFLLALYLFEDWLLFVLALMLVLAIIWLVKDALPKFWSEAVLLLNFGSVREDERIVVDGVPWKVSSLNFQTILTNPSLIGGKIRLPIEDLIDLRSRPITQDEPWFPTKLDDWILLPDTYGKVVFQSPEMVQVLEKGKSIKTYPTSQFLELVPKNLSTGYRIAVDFGIDYQHQKDVTDKILKQMRDFVVKRLEELEYEKDSIKVKVEFHSAGESALNVRLIADMSGQYANVYNRMTRLMNRLCVEACNEYNWIIPFEQLTVHIDQSEA